jgi:hypothetical protein
MRRFLGDIATNAMLNLLIEDYSRMRKNFNNVLSAHTFICSFWLQLVFIPVVDRGQDSSRGRGSPIWPGTELAIEISLILAGAGDGPRSTTDLFIKQELRVLQQNWQKLLYVESLHFGLVVMLYIITSLSWFVLRELLR